MAQVWHRTLAAMVGLIVVSGALAWAANTTNAADPPDKRLARASMFAFGGVGFASVISSEEKDFRSVLARNTAAEDFAKIFRVGTPEAKCYALTGLQRLRPEQFAKMSAELRSSTIQVSVMRGCILTRRPMSELVQAISAGVYSSVFSGEEPDLVPRR